ncbi:MAG: hypothetical protein KAQ75_15150 [Bacteroidales bacterium]|nr:hypothetical protein [Bacteroidales bacterium]
MECKKDQNKENCNCTYPCSKKGVCCDCIAYHRKLGQLPACYFPNEVEKTYDRSISKFLETVNERGYHWN